MNKYIELKDLDVYKLARELSRIAWEIYSKFDWQTKKIIGDQFITAIDSVGANISEGYRRYHYLDKIKFYYISRASLTEAIEHWLSLLYERKFIEKADFDKMQILSNKLSLKLNNFIAVTFQSKNKKDN